MTRPKERIKPILKVIEEIWMKNPDMRLGQLLGNAEVSYFTEDLNNLVYQLSATYGSTPMLWGTRGKNGKSKLKYLRLEEIETPHLAAILETQNVQGITRNILFNELEKRTII